MRKLLIIVALIIVVCVAGMVVYAQWFTDSKQRFTASLSKVTPSKLPGWTVEEVPLAESQGEMDHVEKILKFDQYVSRKYTKGDLEITLYAAYWKPGKRSPIDAGGHNPDSCWVNFGWTRTLREFSITGTKIGGHELLPYEFGIYEKGGASISVMFWHLLNGKPYAYEDHRAGWADGIAGVIFRLPKRLEDLKRLGLNQRREQLFVRISFNRQNFDKVLENPDFAEFMDKIAGLGIFCDSAWSDDAAKETKEAPEPPAEAPATTEPLEGTYEI